MGSNLLSISSLLILLAGCSQQQLSLPVTHASVSPSAGLSSPRPKDEAPVQLPTGVETMYESAPRQTCYAYMRLRPAEQRANAVQARLRKVDQMTAAFDARTFTVELKGDHANILSLQFSAPWPADPEYTRKVSSVVEDYLTTPEVQEYLCASGFAEVRLSQRGVNDGRTHPLWKARITTEGMLKVAP
jgi:hypothetical protein